MEHRGSISDDWEELSDTFSVVSVPASGHGDDQPLLDGDLPDMEKPAAVADLPLRPARSRPSPAEAPTPSLPVPIPQPREAPISEPSLAVSASDVLRRASPNEKAAQMERKQEEDSYTSDFRLDEKEDARRQPTDWQRAAPPGRSPSDLSSDGEVDEILDAHVDPAFFLNVLKSLGGMIDEILAMAATLTSYQSATAIEKVCGLLSAQIQELTPIISGYARCWSSSSQDIPLDPGLQAWMSGVRVRLLGLHDEMQRQCTHPRHSYPSNCDFEVTCQEHCGALSQYEKQMDMFLPIMQVYVVQPPCCRQIHTIRSHRAAQLTSPSGTITSLKPVRSTSLYNKQRPDQTRMCPRSTSATPARPRDPIPRDRAATPGSSARPSTNSATGYRTPWRSCRSAPPS